MALLKFMIDIEKISNENRPLIEQYVVSNCCRNMKLNLMQQWLALPRKHLIMPLHVYNFFKNEGVMFIQFFPIVERILDERAKALGLRLALPASLDNEEAVIQVTEWTVEPEKYGNFLISIFEEWVRNDVGKTFIMNFEWALNAYMGNPSPVCVFAKHAVARSCWNITAMCMHVIIVFIAAAI